MQNPVDFAPRPIACLVGRKLAALQADSPLRSCRGSIELFLHGSLRHKFQMAIAILPVVLATTSCTEVIPATADFAESRCQTVFDDGVEGVPTIELGAIFGMTNATGSDTDALLEARALQLALAELNDQKYIGGKRLRLTLCDTRSHWSTGGGQLTRDLVRWLVEKRNVQAIFTDASSDTQTAAAVAVPRGVLLMAISATSEDLTTLVDNGLVWRVAPSDIYQGAVLAHVATQNLAATDKVTVLAVQSPYGEGLIDALGKALGKRMEAHTFFSDGKGIEAAVQAAANDNSKAIVVVGDSDQLAQIANARADKPALSALPLFTADGACEGSVLQKTVKAGASLASLKCTRPGQSPTDEYNLFVKRFAAKFNGADAQQSGFTQPAYDAMYCVALAYAYATRAGGPPIVTGKALAEGLAKLSSGEQLSIKPNDISKMIGKLAAGTGIDIKGTSGPLDFNDQTGEAPSDYSVWGAGKDGKLANIGYFAVKDQGKGQYAVLPVDVTP